MRILESEQITFDDVLLVPQFSNIESRKDCSTTTSLMGQLLMVPILSANMDCVTESEMGNKMSELGGVGVLHRFQTIEQNIEMFKKSPHSWCSIGVGETEFNRFLGLTAAGCNKFVLDVAHGASKVATDQYVKLQKAFPNEHIYITVGNFATGDSIKQFVKYCLQSGVMVPSAFKVGIGGGSMCTTRIVTGCGVPQLSALIDCVSTGYNIIADGGIRNSGDYAKAMATGVKAIMLGSLLSGTEETPGEIVNEIGSTPRDIHPSFFNINSQSALTLQKLYSGKFKKYRGSASLESYEVQGKVANHRTAEGESTLVSYKGPVENTIQQLQAGLKSSMSYVGAINLTEYKERAIMIRVSGSTQLENGSHGKK